MVSKNQGWIHFFCAVKTCGCRNSGCGKYGCCSFISYRGFGCRCRFWGCCVIGILHINFCVHKNKQWPCLAYRYYFQLKKYSFGYFAHKKCNGCHYECMWYFTNSEQIIYTKLQFCRQRKKLNEKRKGKKFVNWSFRFWSIHFKTL